MHTNISLKLSSLHLLHFSIFAGMTFFVTGLITPTFAQESTAESVINEQLQSVEKDLDGSFSNSPFNPQTPFELVRGDELPFMNARFSPDGEHIAFTGPNYFGLWVADYSQQDSINV